MRPTSGVLPRLAVVLCGGLIGVFGFPGFSPAQEAADETRLYDENEVGQDIRALQQQNSRFRLFGQGDRAVTSLKAVGSTPFGRGMEYFVTNTGIVDAADLNMDSQPNIARSGGRSGQWFDVSPIYAAGRQEWVRFLNDVPSLANAIGGGYAVSRNFPTLGVRELLASDFEFGNAFSGQQSTDDGGCTDQTADALSNIAAGNTLLAGSDCPPTWPLEAGTPTFKGRRKISADAYLATQAAQGTEFNFDWWTVDPSLIEPDARFGNFQTYGAYDDFNSSMIDRFGNVVPGGAGDPRDEGWPLGLRTEFDAFTFALPTVANSMFWRATIINETEQVYGVGLDYQKLYVGYTMMPIRSQESSFYHEVWRGTIFTAEGNTGSPACQGTAPPGAAFIDCAGDAGFGLGVDAHIILKSPIGDLRNVLFTCDPAESAVRAATRAIPCPTGDFFDPGNVHAGDTITYNHMRMCPFGGTCGSTTLLGPDRQMFGAVASNVADYLNGRDIASLSQGEQYAMFRNPNFPQQPGPFSFWVPGTWDYSANGTGAPDTIFVPGCYGPPGVTIQGTTRGAREDACAVTWADTMPVGEAGNSAYNDQEGNVSYWSVGPFALAAGERTALVIAQVAAADSLSIETEVNNVIDLYMNFYLSPEAPPKVNIVGVDVEVEDPKLGGGRGEVRLFWDDASDDFVDPFLENFATTLANAPPESPLGQIRELNCPDPLVDPECEGGIVGDIRERAANNLEQILIFKSCDAGATFTTNDTQNGVLDCDADPAQDITGSGIGPGWQAYARLAVNDQGEAPNSFTDNLVIPGQSYIYTIVGESRGAQFPIVNQVDTDDDGIPDTTVPDSLVLAPSLINPLSTSTSESNVVQVYVPATNQAGAQLAQATITAPDVEGHGTGDFEVRFTGGEVVAAPYRVIFGNRFTVTEIVDPSTGQLDSTFVTVEDVVTAFVPPDSSADLPIQTFELRTANPNGVQIAGTPDSVATVGDTTTTILEGELGILVYRLDTEEPLFITTDLDGEDSTPPQVFGRQAVAGFTGFPGFVVDIDNSQAGDFDRQRYLFSAEGDTIPNQILPTVSWNSQDSERNEDVSSFGTYEITWAGFTFGPGAPFTLDLRDPENTVQAVNQSLNDRAVGQTGRTDAEAAAALSVTEEDLVAVRVPFSVRNRLFDRNVDVAMLRRAPGENSILLGSVGSGDTLSASIPEDAWVPGDQLFFLETVTVDSTIGGNVVLGDDGRPIRNQELAATFAPAILSCGNLPRPSCNPVQGQGSTNDWESNVEGEVLLVFYIAPYQLESQLTFETQRSITGEEAIAAGLDISSQVDSIKVVPNPYVMFSQYQIATPQQNDARLMFTHLPPRGTLRIFTVSGQFVQEIQWEPSELAGNGDLFWDMRTKEGNEIGAGLYVFTVQAQNPAGGGEVKKIGKFVIIR